LAADWSAIRPARRTGAPPSHTVVRTSTPR
jgi:hypothetical protein